jgi:imidazolonepropionase-like amidohydrolase
MRKTRDERRKTRKEKRGAKGEGRRAKDQGLRTKIKGQRSKIISAFIVLICVHLCLAVVNISAQIVVIGETVYTMNGEPIKNGAVVINNGKIEKIGNNVTVQIPAGYKVIQAKVVTPGLIDAHTVVGLNGYLNQPHDQMALDGSSVTQPELRAFDAYNTEERLIEWIRGFGVTTIHTGHQPSALISGQTFIAKTVGKTVEDVTIVPTAMISVTLGEDALAGSGRAPGTRAKQVSMLREMLIKASNYKGEPRDLKMEIMNKVIKRELPLLVTANKAQDIMSALRIAKEFNLKIVLDSATEAPLVINEIKASGFPVIVHASMTRTESLNLETAAKLKAAGIPVALQSGYEPYVPKTRVLLFEVGMAAANGLSMRDALATVTIDAARILGIDKRVGSLEVGKDADLALYDGDPFEWTTHCVGTIIDGKVVSGAIR